MRDFVDDVRSAVRGLIRQPSNTAVAVLILALGIGVNATVFSVLDKIVWPELPYRDAGRLVLATSNRYDAFVEQRGGRTWDFVPLSELAERARFAGVGAAIAGDVTLGGHTPAGIRGAADDTTYKRGLRCGGSTESPVIRPWRAAYDQRAAGSLSSRSPLQLTAMTSQLLQHWNVHGALRAEELVDLSDRFHAWVSRRFPAATWHRARAARS